MRKILVTLATCAVALPLEAQLSPEQRAAQQLRVNADAATRTFESRVEQSSLGGDPAAYAGPTGRDARYYGRGHWHLRHRASQPLPEEGAAGRVIYLERYEDPRIVRGFIGQREGRPLRLRPLGASLLDARAGIPLALTIQAPYGRRTAALVAKVVIADDQGTLVFTKSVEVTADEAQMYRIEVDPLTLGRYDVTVDLLDPRSPEAPLSSTRTALIVWQP